MSRSRRKTPIARLAGSLRRSEKWWKRAWHRVFRRRGRALLKAGREPVRLPEEVGANLWSGPKDGKAWYGDLEGPRKERIMRK